MPKQGTVMQWSDRAGCINRVYQQAGRGVCEAVAQRLGLCGVDAGVAGLILPEVQARLQVRHVLCTQRFCETQQGSSD